MSHRLSVAEAEAFTAALFTAAGLSSSAAARVAAALVEADRSGRGSHGILQADAYLARLEAGTMSTADTPVLVSRSGAVTVLDGADMEGHLAAEAAVQEAIAQARAFGAGVVAMRRVMHFGVLGRYVRLAAEQGFAALGMVNGPPAMAAPGGAEKLAGTNPLAIAFPVEGEAPVVLDMATTAGTIGAVRAALAAGRPLPGGWAVDADGRPTTDPQAALDGFLLPMGGAKGFGLGFVIDLLPGLLAAGGWGPTLAGMREQAPYNASFLLIALDIARFGSPEAFAAGAKAGVERIRASRRAEGTTRLVTPGERSAEALAAADAIQVAEPVAAALRARAARLGVAVPAALAAPASGTGPAGI